MLMLTKLCVVFVVGLASLSAQGVATRGVKPLPRGKSSGLPFHARFTDVARDAGLRAPVICGEVDTKNYILETIGTGAAFFDYDSDGWIDIFLPSGTRRDDPPENATNRLYKNNRNGTFTDVTLLRENLDILKPRLLHDSLEQSQLDCSSYSTGYSIGMLPNFSRKRAIECHVAKYHTTARLENTPRLPKHHMLSHRHADYTIGDHNIHAGVGKGNLLHGTLSKLDVGDA